MKLLHVITSLEIGGASRLLADLLPIQKKQNIDVTLLVNINVDNDFTNHIKSSGITIISLENPCFYSPENILQIRKIIKEYDIIHVHLFPSLYWVAIASIGLKLKLVYTEHSTSNRRRTKAFLKPIERFVYNQYDKIISISEQTSDALKKWLKLNDDRFISIHNGIDIKTFSPKKTHIIPKSVIMISRFVASKDQETLIKAMKLLDPDIILRLVGNGVKLDYCKQLAIEEGVDKRVQFLGARSNVTDLIAESYIGVQSSNWEGFGLTAVEIMSMGKPIIVSDVDGLKQVVSGAGIIFPKGNHVQLAEAIKTLLRDESLYKSMVNKCINRAKEYDIVTMAEQYLKVYEECMCRHIIS